ncbi:GNAT family N-acetyltransferase [Nocardioides sp. Leaf307]|uniref:GNAT family N-acetyltransferase n=1 Tax=Nocardioides sp. Leaf307 TaxID=1736331 RepID=UPI000B1A318A|nr:N-acetyltransferase [Nocardioides sp. Leaf307]
MSAGPSGRDLVVRPVHPQDRESITRVVTAAFGEEGEVVARLVERLEASRAVALGLVAEVGGAVVGHVMLTQCWVDTRERLRQVLVLSPLSVAPDHQRGGVGGALLAAALDAAEADGWPAVFLEGSPAYYSARGFVPAGDHGFERPSPRIPHAAFQVALLSTHDDTLTGPLVYRDAFWQLDCVGLRDPLLAELESEPGGRSERQ